MSEIVLDKVTKHFGAVKAVAGVSFRAEKGKLVVLPLPAAFLLFQRQLMWSVYAGGD